jgi:LmbE family N-acetylglucosaminyl deacetylase
MTSVPAMPGPRGGAVNCAGWLSAHAPMRSGQGRSGHGRPGQGRSGHGRPGLGLRTGSAASADGRLPSARGVLAITARPGPESADLGGLLHAFRAAGARLDLLSLTRGEASALNSTHQRLEVIRPQELQLAAGLLGVSSVAVADYPDGELRRRPIATLTERVERAITKYAPDLILVVDPVVGDADDAQVARAACLAADRAGVPVAGRTWLGAPGGWRVGLGSGAAAARTVQRSAVAAHASQSDGLAEVRSRLNRLGDAEQLRWLLAPEPDADPREFVPQPRQPIAS